MTDNELAEQFADGYATPDIEPTFRAYLYECAKESFLAGLKARELKWHNIKENPNDLPNDGELVLANNLSTIECVKFKKEKDGNHWRHDKFELCYVVKWCEIPKE